MRDNGSGGAFVWCMFISIWILIAWTGVKRFAEDIRFGCNEVSILKCASGHAGEMVKAFREGRR